MGGDWALRRKKVRVAGGGGAETAPVARVVTTAWKSHRCLLFTADYKQTDPE